MKADDSRRTGGSPRSTSSTAASGPRHRTYRDASGAPRRRPRRTATRTAVDAGLHDQGPRRRSGCPAAFAPTKISIGGDVRYDPETASHRHQVGRHRSRAQHVHGRVGDPEPHARTSCRPPSAPAPADIATHYTELPSDFPADLTPAGRRHHRQRLRRRTRRPCCCRTGSARTSPTTSTCQRGHGINAIEAFLEQGKGLLRAVRRHLRRLRPRPRHPGPGRGRVHARARCEPTGSTTSTASTPTPGPRCTSPASAGCPSSRRPTRGAPGDESLHRRAAAAGRRAAAVDVDHHGGGGRPRRHRGHASARWRPDTDLGADIPSPTSAAAAAAELRRRPAWLVTAGIVLRRRCWCWPASGSCSCPGSSRPLGPPPPAQRRHRGRPGAGVLARDRGGAGPSRRAAADRARRRASSPPVPRADADRRRRRSNAWPATSRGRLLRRRRGRRRGGRRRRRSATTSSARCTTGPTAAPSSRWRADPRPLLAAACPGDRRTPPATSELVERRAERRRCARRPR